MYLPVVAAVAVPLTTEIEILLYTREGGVPSHAPIWFRASFDSSSEDGVEAAGVNTLIHESRVPE
jgi:hypothetical protein